jgi:hypothetical protein
MIPLPEVTSEVKASEKAIDQMKACAAAMLKEVPDKEIEVLREGLVCPALLSQSVPLNLLLVLPSRHF